MRARRAAGAAGAHRPGQRGQATVELALCLPLVALALLLVVQVALVVRAQVLVVEAAREGARQAARDHRPGAADRAARAVPGLRPDRLAVRSDGADADDLVTVTATYRAPTEVPIVGALLPDVELHGRVTMRREPDVEGPEAPP